MAEKSLRNIKEETLLQWVKKSLIGSKRAASLTYSYEEEDGTVVTISASFTKPTSSIN